METWLIFFSAVLLLGIISQWLSWQFRFPSILALLTFGFIAGQFFDQSEIVNDDTLFAVVSLSVAVIMLEGGLTLRFGELRESGKPLLRIISVGAGITWVLATVSLHYLAGFSWKVGALIGAILVVTGPTVIGPLLRNVRPKRRLDSILKWEGIVIDPIGAILAVLVFGALFGHGHGHEAGEWQTTAMNLGLTILIGVGFGFVAANGLVFVMRRHWVPDYLQSVVILAVAIALFTVSNLLQHESGLLTVTVLGIGLANQHRAPVRHIIEFKENLRIILISCLFIVLGGRVGWEEIVDVWKEALMLIAALIFVVRPASVFVSLIGTKLTGREKLFLAFMAPRGIVAAAVSAIFALELSHNGGDLADEAARIVPIVFSVIFGTVTFYGLTAAPIARKLGLATPNPQGVIFAGANNWSIKAGAALAEAGYKVLMIDANYGATQKARMAGLPAMNANVISDYVTEEIDLSGIGRLMAVTPNDEVNSLACIGFAHPLGRSNVFQVRPADAGESERKSSSFELSGRQLFGKDGTRFADLVEMDAAGFTAKQTLITDEFTLEDFREEHGEDALVMFIVRQNGTLSIVSEETLPPADGDQIISFVPGDDNEAKG
ncbi:MAG: sodium:proton antiporter [Verrucomicrobiales bacterium]|nr:sodium:proton antiporter [Verrucomicrobiales bacterium]